MIRLVASLVLAGTIGVAACGKERAGARSAASSDTAGASEVHPGRLDPQQVPVNLRSLVPMAERWGIGDDIDRNDKVERVTTAERKELEMALEPHETEIKTWLDSFEQGEMPKEAAAFMYMQLALEEIRAGDKR
jgi:hypothetical protein